ncbi:MULTISPECIES: hypothetical protein [Sediminibacillus]|nr:hypothetical protein [Sediminibacillus terrae]
MISKRNFMAAIGLKGSIERNSVAEEISEDPAEKRAAETPQRAL